MSFTRGCKDKNYLKILFFRESFSSLKLETPSKLRKYSNSEFFFLFSFSEKNLVSIKYCECSLLIFNEFVIAYIYQKMQNDK